VIYLATGASTAGMNMFSSLANNDPIVKKIFYDIRLPRLLNAILTGASLSCSGLILQSLLRNNLAEPGLIGISAGAGLGAILVFTFNILFSFSLLTPVSFIFALLTTLLIYYIAKGLNSKYTNFLSSNKIILAGIAISALLSSVNGFLLIVAGKDVSQIIFWLSGGLNGKGWTEFNSTIIFAAVGLISALLISKELNVISLGDEVSASLGVNLKRVQALSIGIASLLAASAVSVAGIISFAGLVIPNISRIITGPDNRYSIPCTILLGSVFLVISDLIAKTIIAPSEIPVGIITSFIGAPVFIWLILKRKRI